MCINYRNLVRAQRHPCQKLLSAVEYIYIYYLASPKAKEPITMRIGTAEFCKDLRRFEGLRTNSAPLGSYSHIRYSSGFTDKLSFLMAYWLLKKPTTPVKLCVISRKYRLCIYADRTWWAVYASFHDLVFEFLQKSVYGNGLTMELNQVKTGQFLLHFYWSDYLTQAMQA